MAVSITQKAFIPPTVGEVRWYRKEHENRQWDDREDKYVTYTYSSPTVLQQWDGTEWIDVPTFTEPATP